MSCDSERIIECAYIPEHLPDYFIPFSGLKCYLYDDYVYYYSNGDLRFIGYPLSGRFDENDFAEALKHLVRLHRPKVLGVISPSISNYPFNIDYVETDEYYILDLEKLVIRKKVRNIIKRAEREVEVTVSRNITKAHKKLIDSFCKRKGIKEVYVELFKKIPNYVGFSKSAYIIEAWKKGELIAFTIYEDLPKNYGFYLFNFTATRDKYVPGTSDLLFKKCIDIAVSGGKRYINMGLGINEGVRFFKVKWGGRPMSYNYVITHLEKKGALDLLSRL